MEGRKIKMIKGYVGVFRNKYRKTNRVLYCHLSDIPEQFRDRWDNLWLLVRIEDYDGGEL